MTKHWDSVHVRLVQKLCTRTVLCPTRGIKWTISPWLRTFAALPCECWSERNEHSVPRRCEPTNEYVCSRQLSSAAQTTAARLFRMENVERVETVALLFNIPCARCILYVNVWSGVGYIGVAEQPAKWKHRTRRWMLLLPLALVTPFISLPSVRMDCVREMKVATAKVNPTYPLSFSQWRWSACVSQQWLPRTMDQNG